MVLLSFSPDASAVSSPLHANFLNNVFVTLQRVDLFYVCFFVFNLCAVRGIVLFTFTGVCLVLLACCVLLTWAWRYCRTLRGTPTTRPLLKTGLNSWSRRGSPKVCDICCRWWARLVNSLHLLDFNYKQLNSIFNIV